MGGFEEFIASDVFAVMVVIGIVLCFVTRKQRFLFFTVLGLMFAGVAGFLIVHMGEFVDFGAIGSADDAAAVLGLIAVLAAVILVGFLVFRIFGRLFCRQVRLERLVARIWDAWDRARHRW